MKHLARVIRGSAYGRDQGCGAVKRLRLRHSPVADRWVILN